MTNLANSTQDYALTATLAGIANPFAGGPDVFDPSSCAIHVEDGGALGYRVGQDLATFIDKRVPNASKTVYLVCDMPTPITLKICWLYRWRSVMRLKNQTDANQLMSAKGEGTKNALIESQAQLSLSEAQVLEAQDAVTDGRNALAAMLGKEVTALDVLSENFNVLNLEHPDYEAWKTIALENNPEIAAARENVAIAYQEIQRNHAGHTPRLDAIASLSKSKSDSTSTFNQEIDNQSIGLQLNIPIYAGGSVSALTTQAEANDKKSQDDLETKINTVLLDLRKHLFEAKRDLSLARYNYLVAFINLKKAAGSLTVADIEKIAAYFSPHLSAVDNTMDK